MTTYVITVRDPDWENEYAVFGPPPVIIDIDAGRSDLRDPEDFADWKESHLADAARIESDDHGPEARAAAEHIRQVVAQYEEDLHG